MTHENEHDIVDVPSRLRFEWPMGEHVAIVTYRRDGSILSLDHAGVPAALGGRGIGSRLVEGVLRIIRARGESIVPICSFIVRHLERHPEHHDLIARTRADFAAISSTDSPS